MGSFSTIGVDDDFTAGETGVAMGTADDEFPRGIDMVFDVVVEEGEHFLAPDFRLHPWHEDVDDIVLDGIKHALVFVEIVVLGRHHDGVDALGNIVVGVFHRHLTLGVGAQVGHLLAFLAYLGQGRHDEMGNR